MAKLFIKLWVFILLTSFASYTIQRTVFDWSASEAESEYRTERLRRSFIFVEEVLRPYPIDEWSARFDALGKRLGGASRLVEIESLASGGELSAGAIETIRAGNLHLQPLGEGSGFTMYRTVANSQWVAALEVPAPPQRKIFGLFKPIAFTWMVECTLYAIAILLWLRLFWRDLRALVDASEQVGEGTFNVDVKLRRGSALTPLADSFNRMGARIGALMKSQQDLTNAVSHELKTPLSRMRFALSLLPESTTAADRERLMSKMQNDVDALDELVQEMLLYSRLDRQPEMKFKSLPIESWLPNALDDEIEAALASDIRIPVALNATVNDAHCEPKYMGRAVRNLVRNALRFAQTRVEVTVEGDAANGRYRIHVDDDGPGIPSADRPRLFEPFARLDQSRSRDSGGTGLGLAIVERIARWHGGQASIGDSPLGGARISIEWQIA